MIQLNNPYTYFAEYVQSVIALFATFIIISTALEPSSISSRSVSQTMEGLLPIAVASTPGSQPEQVLTENSSLEKPETKESQAKNEKADLDKASFKAPYPYGNPDGKIPFNSKAYKTFSKNHRNERQRFKYQLDSIRTILENFFGIEKGTSTWYSKPK